MANSPYIPSPNLAVIDVSEGLTSTWMSNIRKAPPHFDDVQLLETSKSVRPVKTAFSPVMDFFFMHCKTELASFVAWIAASYYHCKNIYLSRFSAEI